ncbi:MAG TPA: arginine--tRNA ligase, partial [bacterium]|nr:arginine--tRNA ligase [bacterium]
ELPEAIAAQSDLLVPPQSELGDLSWPCFAAAKKLGLSPVELAKDLAIKLTDLAWPEVNTWQAAGPYLNCYFNGLEIAPTVIDEIKTQAENYGRSAIGQGQKIMIEYSNANTHKEYHVGHLRNLFFGDSVQRILNFCGYKAIPVSYLNDFGIHIAKVIWKLNQLPADQAIPANRGFYLGQIYVEASQELKDNPDSQIEVGAIMQRLEAKLEPEYSRWQETRQWSVDQFNDIYRELDIHFEHTFFESEYLDQGREIVEQMLNDGRLEKSQGAVIANLEQENLGVLPIFRSDGTSLYPVADLPLAQAKFNDYQLDESWYVIDERQSLYIEQLAAVLGRLGINKPIRHLSYSFVKLPSGMMSSRNGTVITYEDLKERLLSKEREEINRRHTDWSDSEQAGIAWQVVSGALKFEMIKVGADKPITFDIEQALSFEGFTAAYIQYAAVRLAAVIRQADGIDQSGALTLGELLEKNLLLRLARFNQVIELSAQQTDPSVLAKYLFELAQAFNDYYQKVRIIGSEQTASRLQLAMAIRQVLVNGLNLLGINAPKAM